MREIIIDSLPSPSGHYSHAIISGKYIHTSGMLPVGLKVDSSLEEQFNKVFDMIEQILAACGSSLDDVLSCHIYLADLKDWDEVNDLYAKKFGEHRPARCLVPVPALHFGYLLEAEVMAEISEENRPK